MAEKTNQRLIELDDLFAIQAITEAQFSPDGKQIVYGVAQIDVEKDKQLSGLWLYSLESGKHRRLTSGQYKDWGAAWSPDGKNIAFLAQRDELPQIYVIAADGGEPMALTNLKQPIGGAPVWSPDGKQIAFTAGPKMEAPPDPKKPYRVDRTVYRFDGAGYLDTLVQDIYVIAAEGGEPRQLTKDRFNNSAPCWSPDGRQILFMALADPVSSTPHCQVLQTVDLEGNLQTLHKDWGVYQTAAWMPDGKGIVFCGQKNGLPIGSKTDLWVYNLESQKTTCRTPNQKFGVGGSLRNDLPVSWKTEARISRDGKKAFVNMQIGGTVQVCEVALNGKEACKMLISGDRLAALLDISEEKLLFVVTDFHQPCNLVLANLDGSAEEAFTNLNPLWAENQERLRVEHLLFPGSDGVQVEGWALLPAEGDAPFPTVLCIHGGPHSAFGHAFNFDYQLLCAKGYAVLLINHRASTGYGDEFSTAIKGDWGNLDYKDLMAGVDYAIEKGFCDPDRLGCTGISGGGNLSCWIVGHTNRFKAAAPQNPVTNWLSFYGTSDIGIWFSVEELGGHPHEIPEVYRKCSPVTYAHQCTTPTLMVQGEQDYRCPAEQSEQFYSILKANGCVTEMLRFPNSYHGGAISGPLAIRRAHREALLDWMDRYLKVNIENETGGE